MYLVIEHLGNPKAAWITNAVNKSGEAEDYNAGFDTKQEAEEFAKEFCAFRYVIVEIN